MTDPDSLPGDPYPDCDGCERLVTERDALMAERQDAIEMLKRFGVTAHPSHPPEMPLTARLIGVLDRGESMKAELATLRAALVDACNVLDELGSKQAFRLRNQGGIEP